MLRRISAVAPFLMLILVSYVHGQKPIRTASGTGPASNTAQAPTSFELHRLMSSEQFRESGLGKLSPAEMTSLNQWLDSFSSRLWISAKESPIATRDNASTLPLKSTIGSVIESEIDGDFEGWSGETIFKLNNGQIWQQTEYSYEYEYAYSPEVMIYKTSECYKMKVEDMSDAICVKRLR